MPPAPTGRTTVGPGGEESEPYCDIHDGGGGGEGVGMMQPTGQGELFVANLASEVQVPENDEISVNGANALAFSSSIEWDIKRVQARGAAMTGGLSHVFMRGGSGETLQMAFTGQDYVLVQPSESVLQGGHQASGPTSSGSGGLGGLLGG